VVYAETSVTRPAFIALLLQRARARARALLARSLALGRSPRAAYRAPIECRNISAVNTFLSRAREEKEKERERGGEGNFKWPLTRISAAGTTESFARRNYARLLPSVALTFNDFVARLDVPPVLIKAGFYAPVRYEALEIVAAVTDAGQRHRITPTINRPRTAPSCLQASSAFPRGSTATHRFLSWRRNLARDIGQVPSRIRAIERVRKRFRPGCLRVVVATLTVIDPLRLLERSARRSGACLG